MVVSRRIGSEGKKRVYFHGTQILKREGGGPRELQSYGRRGALVAGECRCSGGSGGSCGRRLVPLGEIPASKESWICFPEALNPEKWTDFKLVQRVQVSPNVTKFRFALQTPTTILGLPTGQHMTCLGKDRDGAEVTKPYTPTTLDSDVGYFELVVKIYSLGRMSYHFSQLKVGDYLSCKGPKGRFNYKPNKVRAYGMLAGGSGLTPMYQVTRAILENPADKTKISLIYGNVTYEDILLKEELDDMVKKYPGRFSVYYVLNDPPADWNGGVGFVTADMIKKYCPTPAEDIQILRCGPPPMNKAMAGHLEALGYSKEMQFQF